MYKLVILLFTHLISAHCYKPVILLHGILTGYESMELIKARILEVTSFLITFYNLLKFFFITETPRNTNIQYRKVWGLV